MLCSVEVLCHNNICEDTDRLNFEFMCTLFTVQAVPIDVIIYNIYLVIDHSKSINKYKGVEILLFVNGLKSHLITDKTDDYISSKRSNYFSSSDDPIMKISTMVNIIINL